MEKAKAERKAKAEKEARAKQNEEDRNKEIVDLIQELTTNNCKEKSMSEQATKTEEKKELTQEELTRARDVAVTRAANVVTGALLTGLAIGVTYMGYSWYSGRKEKAPQQM